MIRLQSSSVPLTESMKREDMKREDDDPMRDSPRGKSRQTADMTGTGLRLELIGMTPPRVPLVSWGLLVLTGVYVLAGKFGLSLAFVHASASAVWPPTGIALAATLLLGYRVWPALLLGAFLVNVTTAGSVWTSLGIAGGNTLEGLLGAFLVRRFANGLKVFDRARDIFTFGVLAGLGATAVSATVGVTTLWLGGHARWEGLGAIWLTWWLGDVAGAVVVAAGLILWGLGRTVRLTRAQVVELLLLLGSVLLVGEVVFGGLGSPWAWNYPLEFLCIPPLVVAAFRFGPREAATCVALLSVLANWGTLHGLGPFVRYTPNESLLLLQAFMGTMAMMTLLLAANVKAHARTEAALARVAAIEAAVRERDALRYVASLAAAAAHEINNPLAVVVGQAELLDETLDATGQKRTEEILQATRRIEEIVGRMKGVSRLKVTGEAPYIPEMLDLDKSSEPGAGSPPSPARQGA